MSSTDWDYTFENQQNLVTLFQDHVRAKRILVSNYHSWINNTLKEDSSDKEKPLELKGFSRSSLEKSFPVSPDKEAKPFTGFKKSRQAFYKSIEYLKEQGLLDYDIYGSIKQIEDHFYFSTAEFLGLSKNNHSKGLEGFYEAYRPTVNDISVNDRDQRYVNVTLISIKSKPNGALTISEQVENKYLDERGIFQPVDKQIKSMTYNGYLWYEDYGYLWIDSANSSFRKRLNRLQIIDRGREEGPVTSMHGAIRDTWNGVRCLRPIVLCRLEEDRLNDFKKELMMKPLKDIKKMSPEAYKHIKNNKGYYHPLFV